MTIPTQLVLRALLSNPDSELYGVEIGAEAGLPSGTVHPILARLEGLGWVTSRWEDIDPSVAGRPARRYYQVDAQGAEAARNALAMAYQSRRAPRTSLIPQPGE
ncbi:PadR family transcriptional regulator [Microbacterium deminutum]|uniref:Transcription regulator PadR N-terminal domain-containing protein n=1 Tax=Microbacterium deminutum TaxID=344164 RepID=A0ABP5CTT3_9MICO